jgi:hypothetical protein
MRRRGALAWQIKLPRAAPKAGAAAGNDRLMRDIMSHVTDSNPQLRRSSSGSQNEFLNSRSGPRTKPA